MSLLRSTKRDLEERVEMELSEINEKLVDLPGKISEKKILLEKAKAKLDHESSKLLLALDKKEYSNADLRKAAVEANENIYKLKVYIAETEGKYYEYVNFFQGVTERARNIRAEMKSLGDGV